MQAWLRSQGTKGTWAREGQAAWWSGGRASGWLAAAPHPAVHALKLGTFAGRVRGAEQAKSQQGLGPLQTPGQFLFLAQLTNCQKNIRGLLRQAQEQLLVWAGTRTGQIRGPRGTLKGNLAAGPPWQCLWGTLGTGRAAGSSGSLSKLPPLPDKFCASFA